MSLPDLSADRSRALALTPVSRETAARLDRFVALLLKWQEITHLIAPSTVPILWTRHIADSLQLIELAPDAETWSGLGTGGGVCRRGRHCDRPRGFSLKLAARSVLAVAQTGSARIVPEGTRCRGRIDR